MVVRIDTGFHGLGRCWTWSRVCGRRTGRAGFVNRCRIRNACPEQRRCIGCQGQGPEGQRDAGLHSGFGREQLTKVCAM